MEDLRNVTPKTKVERRNIHGIFLKKSGNHKCQKMIFDPWGDSIARSLRKKY